MNIEGAFTVRIWTCCSAFSADDLAGEMHPLLWLERTASEADMQEQLHSLRSAVSGVLAQLQYGDCYNLECTISAA